MKRPTFWILLGVVSAACAFVSFRYFPQAFSIVALDITMDRDRALAEARAIMARDRLGPAGYRQAASFALDEEAQTFVELEGGGKDAFTRMLQGGLYAAYTWRVRQFREGETNETTIRFTPDGRPDGFVERIREDAPGPALDAAAARRIAETGAASRWRIDVSQYSLVERGQERRPSGRVDHTLTYERASPTLNEGRYRLRLVVSGDRLTEVTHFLKIPEAFSRRYLSMRSANDAIGIGSVVGMALLYVFGGIGVGLFFMLRLRWVLWRQAAFWGVFVALLQSLAAVNEFPLLWMTYDTAVPRATFLVERTAVLTAMFVGFSAFFALSFMAAETLTRRAFGSHPQLWRVWSKKGPAADPAAAPGASTAVLGRTVGGLLLVSVFFAYDVVLYLVTTRTLGWWSPSEALLHPDVLATYAPWLSAIANSFQAGFWEESLFRAVPLASAALIGDRFGKRRLFLILGFIVQAIIFGSGHAPYPNQPSYARPVELLIPSIGFGLLYVHFGLLPGIILHFTFDVVWFALPIFLANAPGIWVQKLMVVLLTLVPLWIVLWRRMQIGRWTVLSPADRNAAWTPSPAPEQPLAVPDSPPYAIGPRMKTVWLALGALAAIVCACVVLNRYVQSRREPDGLSITRLQAAGSARRALAERGVTLTGKWRVMPLPDDGSGAPHEFVSETAGEARRRALLGVYLPKPRWIVRVATFEGDVADRAEEWRVFVASSGEVRNVQHTLPEARPGASLDEAAARRLAQGALAVRLGLDVARGQAREISARPSKLKARTDWTFTFVDTTIPPLPQGEPRIQVDIAGDEVAAAGRFIYVPEEWTRQERAADTRNTVLRILSALVFAGLLVAAAVAAVIGWSRRQYTPRLFLAGAGTMFAVALARGANNSPTLIASLPTVAPLPLEIGGVIAISLVGVSLTATIVGLALGWLPRRLGPPDAASDPDALRLGLAIGFVGAALSAAAAALRTPPWAQTADFTPAGSVLPIVQVVLDPITGLLTRAAIIIAVLAWIDRVTAGWTRRKGFALVALALIGFLGAGGPAGSHLGGWLAGGTLIAAGLIAIYATALRADLTMAVPALGAMTIVAALARGAQRPFPGALPGSLGAAVAIALVAWWWFHALRRWRRVA